MIQVLDPCVCNAIQGNAGLRMRTARRQHRHRNGKVLAFHSVVSSWVGTALSQGIAAHVCAGSVDGDFARLLFFWFDRLWNAVGRILTLASLAGQPQPGLDAHKEI
ncbi:hypothetical protein GCM10027081_26760 [Cupriavidus yeoncheonensis]